MKTPIFSGFCNRGLVEPSYLETGDIHHVILLVIKIKKMFEEEQYQQYCNEYIEIIYWRNSHHNYETVDCKKSKSKINLADMNDRLWKHNSSIKLAQYLF